MKIATSKLSLLLLLPLLFVSIFTFSQASPPPNAHKNFVKCLTRYSHNSSITKVIYTPTNSSYTQKLDYSINNLRFAKPSTPKPQVIVTPENAWQIQAVIYCSKKHEMEIRIRSGGHSFEGLSYVSNVPFVLLDMVNVKSYHIDTKKKTAWIGSGLTLGEVYYRIGMASDTLGFPGGLWSTIGSGGLISGGGYGMLRRKHGLAADNVIDARLIDVHGRILSRKTMGEDLFWAIRGGSGGSFGVILSWKIGLVDVPKRVTVFRVYRTLEQNMTNILYRYQDVAAKFPKELDIRCNGQTIVSNASARADNKTIQMEFESLYLGGVDDLLSVMNDRFPELGVTREDCSQVSWLQSCLFFSNLPLNAPPQQLLNTTILPRFHFKGRSDFIRQPIPINGLQGLWDKLFELPPQAASFQYTPFGGKMDEIADTAIPFPYRAGTLAMLLMYAQTQVDENDRLEWVRGLATYLTPYVTNSPRGAYVNYVDLWLGTNNPHGKTSYERASKWGKRYFKHNFDRLIQVKSVVDPDNFFRHEQSIPPLFLSGVMGNDHYF